MSLPFRDITRRNRVPRAGPIFGQCTNCSEMHPIGEAGLTPSGTAKFSSVHFALPRPARVYYLPFNFPEDDIYDLFIIILLNIEIICPRHVSCLAEKQFCELDECPKTETPHVSQQPCNGRTQFLKSCYDWNII